MSISDSSSTHDFDSRPKFESIESFLGFATCTTEIFRSALTHPQDSQNNFTYSFSNEAIALLNEHFTAIELLLTTENARRRPTHLRLVEGGLK